MTDRPNELDEPSDATIPNEPAESPEPAEPAGPEPAGPEPAESSDPAEAAVPAREGRALQVVAIGLCTLVVVSLIALAAVAYRVHRADQADDARSAALAQAKVSAATVLSYDYRHLDSDFAAARKLLTGDFADKYARTTRGLVGPQAAKIHARVTARVQGASVVSASADRVVVLLFVDQQTISDLRKSSRLPDQNRVRMTLDDIDGRWLVSDVDAL